MAVLTIRHLTTYRYRRPVSFGAHRLMLRPRESYDQRLIEARLSISPEPASLHWIHDVHGNAVAIAGFDRDADTLSFESSVRLEHRPSGGPDFRIDDDARLYPFAYDEAEMPDLEPLTVRRHADPDRALASWVGRFLRQGAPTETGTLLMTLTYAIRESFSYARRTESGTQDPGTTLRLRRGTCRDFALLMIEAARTLGLAARFVSGYIYVPSRDAGTTRGGGSTHAWCQVYLPGAGWIDFDPTNGIVGNRDLVRVALAREPAQAIPLSGTWWGEAADSLGMSVEVLVRRVSPQTAPA